MTEEIKMRMIDAEDVKVGMYVQLSKGWVKVTEVESHPSDTRGIHHWPACTSLRCATGASVEIDAGYKVLVGVER